MTFLLRSIRPIILAINSAIVVIIFLITIITIHSQPLVIIRLTQAYALFSLLLLYLTLLPSPLYRAFPTLAYQAVYIRARRALGVSVFFTALLHGSIAFFLSLGGFEGLPFLSPNYLLSVTLSFLALCILLLLTLTAFDYWVKKLGKRWKMLHRFVYVGGILILIHAFIIGSDFRSFSSPLSVLLLLMIVFLLILESYRFDLFLRNTFPKLPNYSIGFIVPIVVLGIVLVLLYIPNSSIPSLNIHSQHQQIAQDLLTQSQSQQQSKIPSLIGDRTKRYTVSFYYPDQIQPKQDTTLHFKIFDASSGNPVTLFRTLYEKPMHMIIVNSQLNYFTHIHPTQDNDEFWITTQFPADGIYHVYLNFQPFGAIEQQFAFTVPVGTALQINASQNVDKKFTKTFGTYQVTMSPAKKLQTQALTLGDQKISFTIRNATTQKPITNLKPYLAAFGHLVMINKKTYDYIHVHPTLVLPPPPNSNGGPTVEFLPIGLYGPLQPGIYRVFAQFNPDNKLFTADFTVELK